MGAEKQKKTLMSGHFFEIRPFAKVEGEAKKAKRARKAKRLRVFAFLALFAFFASLVSSIQSKVQTAGESAINNFFCPHFSAS